MIIKKYDQYALYGQRRKWSGTVREVFNKNIQFTRI